MQFEVFSLNYLGHVRQYYAGQEEEKSTRLTFIAPPGTELKQYKKLHALLKQLRTTTALRVEHQNLGMYCHLFGKCARKRAYVDPQHRIGEGTSIRGHLSRRVLPNRAAFAV